MTKKHGFTLIELSIVLVIIGLIIGGVLVGRDLIEAAKIRKQVSELENVSTATAAFKLKYNCLPGDCASATSIFGTTGSNGLTIGNGDGDSIVRAMQGDTTDCGSGNMVGVTEPTQFWEHLFNANLWGFSPNPNPPNNTRVTPGVDIPFNSYNRTGLLVSCIGPSNVGTWSFNENLSKMKNVIVVGAAMSDLVNYAAALNTFIHDGSNQQGLPFEAVRAIDRKVDDGVPSTGNFGVIGVQGGSGAYWNNGCGGAGIGYQGGTNTYDTFTQGCLVTAGKLLGL